MQVLPPQPDQGHGMDFIMFLCGAYLTLAILAFVMVAQINEPVTIKAWCRTALVALLWPVAMWGELER